MVLKSLNHTGVVNPVLEQFRQAIDSGAWAPGSKIPTEDELTAMLGVGRGVVREALAVLKAFGLIDSRAGRGTFVTSNLSSLETWIVAIGSDNRELLEARYAIDSWIADLAARRATPGEIVELEDLVRQMERVIAEGRSLDDFVVLDGRFHETLARATHNSVLARLSILMAASLQHSRRANISTKALLDEAMHSHRELLEAVCARDGRRARAASCRSLRRVARMQGITIDADDEFASDIGEGAENCSPTSTSSIG